MSKFAEIVKATADPAAGGELAYTADEDMIVHAISFLFTADANVANRTVRLTVEDASGNVYFRTQVNSTITAGQAITIAFFEGAPQNFASYLLAPLPCTGLRIPSGHVLRSSTLNKQVGDDYGVARIQATRGNE